MENLEQSDLIRQLVAEMAALRAQVAQQQGEILQLKGQTFSSGKNPSVNITTSRRKLLGRLAGALVAGVVVSAALPGQVQARIISDPGSGANRRVGVVVVPPGAATTGGVPAGTNTTKFGLVATDGSDNTFDLTKLPGSGTGVYGNGRIGITGTSTGGYSNTLPTSSNIGILANAGASLDLTLAGIIPNTGLYAIAQGATSSCGVYGSGGTYGVYGSGGIYGMYGSGPTGVYGTGTNYGVNGSSNNGTGVYGTSNSGTGVSGTSTGNTGVSGTGATYGVSGSGSTGVYGTGTIYGVNGSSTSGTGVNGTSTSNGAIGVSGSNPNGIGVSGSGNTGVSGTSAIATGVSGTGFTGVSGTGTNYGVTATCTSGIAVSATNTNGYGVNSTSTNGTGVYGSSTGGIGVKATSTNNIGVYGSSTGGYAVYATSTNSYGVFGNSTSSIGVYGSTSNAASYAGYFAGNVSVSGTLSKGGGSFKIDHPLDPANKYLYHSFVESPDMLNIYNGLVTLDAKGEAEVQMPDWFEALNCDFRYQLTPLGSFSPLFISQKIGQGKFKIAGGAPGQEISWQVIGIRQDAFAKAHRIPVEEDKTGDEKGRYLYPLEHGVSEEQGIGPRSLPVATVTAGPDRGE